MSSTMTSDITSAEALTKHLRSKNIKVDEVIAISKRLVDGEYPVYFPNHTQFIMELIIDRFAKPEFRNSVQIWEIFNSIWTKEASKFFNAKFTQVLLQLPDNAELVEEVVKTVQRLNATMNLELSTEVSLQILGKFIKFGHLSTWFQLVNIEPFTKKSATMFTDLVLLQILRSTDDKRLADLVANFFESEHYVGLLKQFTKKPITNDDRCRLFQFAMQNIKVHSELEEIYLMVTSKETAARLLNELTSKKKTMSQAFLQTIFDGTSDWQLVIQLLALDIEIGINNFDLITQRMLHEKNLEAASALLECFVKAREFPKFLKQWQSLLEKDGFFAQLSTLVSSHIKVLSVQQLKTIISELIADLNPHAVIVLSTVVSGFSSMSYLTIPQFKTLFLSIFEGEQMWALKFQLLEYFDDIVSKDEALVIIDTKSSDINYLYACFRLRELYDIDISSVITRYMKVATSETNKFLLTRFYSVVGVLFDKKYISQVCKDLPDVLIEDFFEEPNLTSVILDNLSETINSNVLGRLMEFPIRCFNRHVRLVLLDKVFEHILSGKDIDLGILVLCHLLQNPTYKSQVESDFSKILKLFEITKDESVFTLVWNEHLKQRTEEVSQKYIEQTIQTIVEQLSSVKQLSSTHYASLIILKSFDSEPLREAFVASCMEILKTQEHPWFIDALYSIDAKIENPMSLISSLSKNTNLYASLFLFYSKNYTGNVAYFLALYIALRQLGVTEIKQGLQNVMKDNILSAMNCVTVSLINDNGESSEFLVEILEVVYPLLDKTMAKEFITNVSCVYSSLNKSHKQYMELLQKLLVEKPWLFDQYCVELLFPMCDKFSEFAFVEVTLVLSNLLQFHRYKLSSRHHLILTTLCYLFAKCQSVEAAVAFSRLLSNLCEPKDANSTEIKRGLRRHVPVLITTYIFLSLNRPFTEEVRQTLLPGIFTVFDVMSQDELNVINASLDSPGRTYYKSLYNEYKKIGKWQG